MIFATMVRRPGSQCFTWLICAPFFALAGSRDPVLKQVDIPHSYYWREMYIPQPTTGPGAAAFSPDGKQVVYSMAGSLWQQTIGSDAARELTHGPGYDLQPDWSSDGRWIVFVRYHRDAMELWRLEVATAKQQALTRGGAVNLEPRFSPDGRKLLFVSTQGTKHFDLNVADLGEQGLSNTRHLVPPRESKLDRYYYSTFDHAINASWSPDGERVFYVGNPEVAWGSGDIWSIAVRDPNDRKRVLTDETTWAARPELSPDGKRLLYSTYQGRQWHQLWITTPEGHSPLPVTFGEFDRRNARWSPDGQRFLYISNETGDTSLWVQDFAGGARTRIVARERQYGRPMASLTVSLREEKDEPLSGRVMVRGSDGRAYAPHDAWLHGDDGYDRSSQAEENRYFHCRDSCEVTVPLGSTHVTVLAGFERRPVQQTVAVGEKGAEFLARLVRNALPAKFGEHTGADLHVHMNYGGHYRQHAEGLAAQAQAEDLDVVYNLIVNKEQRIPDIAEFAAGARRIGATTIFQGQEFHTSYWGHLGLLHLEEHLLLPDFSSYRHTGLASPQPDNGVIADRARAQGALVGYVHPYDWRIVPEKEKSLTHALPVDVALGKVDYLEVVSFADPHATAEVWHRLLNLGFRLPAAAGTDAMTNYASLRGPVGLNRVYLATTERTPQALRAAIREGRGFATNAPLLGLRVEGAGPGATVKPRAGNRVRIEAAVRSIVPLSDVELVFNGEPLRRLRGDFDGDITVPGSGWLLLRAWNRGPHPLIQDLYPYGTTNPVWIDAGRPASRPAADAAYFIRWIDRIIESAQARTDYTTDAERSRTLERLNEARAVFTLIRDGRTS
jgi:TolB protein